jgi:UDP-glucose 4-epimerase
MKNILLVGHGYIGSYLYQDLLSHGYKVALCDQLAHNLIDTPTSKHSPYQSLSSQYLEKYDTILWFAGHSSVPMSIKDPTGALNNNCFDLFEFAKRKPATTQLIYASTASIYSVLQQSKSFIPPSLAETEARLNPVNPYDCSKIAFDALASGFLENVTGLRLGTLSGYSPKLRKELVFNAMNIAAINEGVVRVANAHAYRSILFLSDLAHYVRQIINSSTPAPKVLNVASLSASVGSIAKQIASAHQVSIEEQPDSITYSFQMDCSLINKLYIAPAKLSLAEQCVIFKKISEKHHNGKLLEARKLLGM